MEIISAKWLDAKNSKALFNDRLHVTFKNGEPLGAKRIRSQIQEYLSRGGLIDAYIAPAPRKPSNHGLLDDLPFILDTLRQHTNIPKPIDDQLVAILDKYLDA